MFLIVLVKKKYEPWYKHLLTAVCPVYYGSLKVIKIASHYYTHGNSV